MKAFDTIVVGGGPAGSSCAASLVQAGHDVLVLDRAHFPRTKLCAGWITPEVVVDLAIDATTYPHRFNTFDGIVTHVKGLRFTSRNPQHSIRRYEFDDWLLQRSGAPVLEHQVREVRFDGTRYIIDDTYCAANVVGAGGTRCPVYRCLFRAANPRADDLQVVTLEQEFEFDWQDPRCHLWFFDSGLPGYSWYVPKRDGWLNCGLGAMARRLQHSGEDIRSHWRRFCAQLAKAGLVGEMNFQPKGYSYYLRGKVDVVRIGGAYLSGDAAGLATRDLCEGIGPAVRSGQRAAQAILHGGEYRLDDLARYSANRPWVRWALDRMFCASN